VIFEKENIRLFKKASLLSFCKTFSAGGQLEHPSLVNNSTTAKGVCASVAMKQKRKTNKNKSRIH